MRRHADLTHDRSVRSKPALSRACFHAISIWVTVSACSPLAEISIQVLEPGTVTIPAHVGTISFLNRSYVPSALAEDSSIWTPEEQYIMDTIISHRIFKGIAEGLSSSPLFDLDSLRILQDRRYDTTGFLSPMTRQQLDRIPNDPDALVSLEYYKMSGSRDLWWNEIEYTAALEFYSETYWRIHDRVKDTLLDRYMLLDTLVFEATGESPREALNRLPLVTDALREAGQHAGALYGRRISPSWTEDFRYYYKGPGEAMKTAARLAVSDSLPEAVAIWRSLANGLNRTRAARASYNMAVYCETEDQLAHAMDWAVKSYILKEDVFTMSYIDLLQVRIRQREKLELQVPDWMD